MELVLKNNAIALLGASLGTADTTLTLATGHGVNIPEVLDGSQYAVATLANRYNTKIEIVHITAHEENADTLVLVRAREDTVAQEWDAGDRFELRPTAGVFKATWQAKEDAETAAATLTYATEEEHLAGERNDRMVHPLGMQAKIDEELSTPDTRYCHRENNLDDLDDEATSRNNLGLGSAAVQDDDRYCHRGNNLSDLNNPATSRNNLGLGSAALQPDSRYCHRGNNLSDIPNKSVARDNLNLGSVSTFDRGTGSGEVPTSGQINNVIASYNAGGLGTYAMARNRTSLVKDFGNTISGSNLRVCDGSGQTWDELGVLSGTWRCMGGARPDSADIERRMTIWLRIA